MATPQKQSVHNCPCCRCVEEIRDQAAVSSNSDRSGGGVGRAEAGLEGGSGLSGASAELRFRGPSGRGSGGSVLGAASDTGDVELGQLINGYLVGDGLSTPDLRKNIDEDGDVCVAEVVANHLLLLNTNPRYEKLKLAFDNWEKTFELFQKRRESKETQRDAVRNEIYQLVGFYIVFQGVVFTAVAQAAALDCHTWWTAFLLSLLASVVTLGGIVQKLRAFWDLEVTIAGEKTSSKVLRKRIHNLLAQGPENFNFKKHAKDGVKNDLKKPGSSVVVYMITVICVLLIFSAIFLVSIWGILCQPGDACSSPSPAPA